MSEELSDKEFEKLLDLHSSNTPQNLISREEAEKIIEENQRVTLDSFGGYPFRKEIETDQFTIIVWGVHANNTKESTVEVSYIERER